MQRMLRLCLGMFKKKVQIVFLAGGGDWGSAQDARYIEKYFPTTTSEYEFYRWQSKIPPLFCPGIVHFYSRYVLLTIRPKILQLYRASVLTWFHGDPQDNKSEFGKLGKQFERYLPKLNYVTTSCQLTMEKLKRWGIREDKLKVVPLGVDLELFRLPTAEERVLARQRFGIPQKALCIASFQKDGVGWKEGLEPKLVKGPDTFLKVIKRLNTNFPLFILLSGPARGYIIKGLEKLGVSYYHSFVKQHKELLPFYYAADVYLITSREEGGPLALLESLATGLPVVSTKVGMAPDVINHGDNGFLAEVDDFETLATLVVTLISRPDLQDKFSKQGYKTAMKYSWDKITRKLVEDVYSECLKLDL